MMRLVLRMLGWALAFVITLEVCARVDDSIAHGAPLLGPYDNETLYTYDHLGKKGKPGGQYLKWKLNAQGFRGPELQPGRSRIICIGSSETFGLYEQENGEWPRQLERILNQRTGKPAFDVINAAYPGMSLATTLKRLPGWLKEFQPKAVVIYPSLANYITLPKDSARPATAPKRPFFESRLAGRIETLLKSVLPEPLQDRLRVLQTDRAAKRLSVMPAIPEKNVTRFREDLEQVIALVEASGSRVVLVTHATLFGAEVRPEYRAVLRGWRKFYPMLAENGFLDMEERLNGVMRKVAAERGLALVDASRKMPTGHKAFVEFVHFTDEGAKTLAQLIADRLQP